MVKIPPAAIAKRLSRPQKVALLWLPKNDWKDDDKAVSSTSLFCLADVKLADCISARLTERRISQPPIKDGKWQPYRTRLTSLGRKVREVVEADLGLNPDGTVKK